MGVRWLDHRCTGSAKDRGRVPAQLDLIDEHLDPRDDDASQRRTFADGAFGEELKAELEAVGNDALLVADAHDDTCHCSFPRHVDGDGHDAFREAQFVHQDALAVGTSRASSCSTIATASGTALATGSLRPMHPSFSGPRVSGSQPTTVTLRGRPPSARTSANTESGVIACPWNEPSA